SRRPPARSGRRARRQRREARRARGAAAVPPPRGTGPCRRAAPNVSWGHSSPSGAPTYLMRSIRESHYCADMTADSELTEPPAAGTEVETLIGSLERQRRTFAWKCGGLDSAGLRATTAATTMTLGGLLKHLALVEREYFGHRLLGEDPGPPWNAVDFDEDPDWEWRTAAADSPQRLY